MKIELDMYQTLALAVLVLMLGKFLRERVRLLDKFCIPAPVIGGVLFAIFTCICYVTGVAEFAFDDTLKEVCMVMFFTSVGFQANLKVLKSGGKAMIVFLGVVIVLIVSQNFLAVGLANLLGVDLNLQYPAGWLQAREIKFSQGYTRPGPRDYVGKAPLTQRESRALADFTSYLDPALILAYHTQGEQIYWKYDDIDVPGALALGQEFARLSGYSLEETPYASGFAGYKDWFIKVWRRPGFTIEAGLGENPLPISQFDTIYAKNLGILTTAALGLPA